MSQPPCQCEIPADARFVECSRHLDADGKPLRKSRRLAELCNMGARGEALGLPYWRAWEEGQGPGQAVAPPQPEPATTPAQPASRAHDTPNRARARRLACLECPDGNWDQTRGICPLLAGRPCTMRSLFNGHRIVCKHWPE